eukprot:GEMP01085084.1.p1 GENE.GEMP01085084.1~~GEMP01085084.1.p1  ORF type:complete len:208 (+),score=40.88 GEMP01085084.1:64-687(+)
MSMARLDAAGRRRRRKGPGIICGERLNQTHTFLTASRANYYEDRKWQHTPLPPAPRQKLVKSEETFRRTMMDTFYLKRCAFTNDVRATADDDLFAFRDLHNGAMRLRTLGLEGKLTASTNSKERREKNLKSWHASCLHDLGLALSTSNKYKDPESQAAPKLHAVELEFQQLKGADFTTKEQKRGNAANASSISNACCRNSISSQQVL